jgi:hypothetical protein
VPFCSEIETKIGTNELRMLFDSRHCYLEIHLYLLHLLLLLLQFFDPFISYIRNFGYQIVYIMLWTFVCSCSLHV